MAKEKSFDIPVVRTGYGFATITVKAKNQKEAEKKALEEAGNHDYSEKDADYQLENGSGDDKKHVVYVAWERQEADEMENGKIALNKVEKFEFDTIAEVKAFRLAIEKCAGSDAPYHVTNGEFEIKGRTLHLK